MRTPAARLVLFGTATALTYIVGAHLGFRLAFVAEQVTTVWAPTGISLAALLLGGLRLWPAVWLGAFVANASSTAPMWTAFFIASGNAAEAIVAVWALRRIHTFGVALTRARDVLAFVGVAAIGCTTISATVGVVTLCAAGAQSWALFDTLWFDWWLGDALGAIIVAPAILTTARHVWSRGKLLQALTFSVGSLLVTEIVFGRLFNVSEHPFEYGIFPLVIAAAVTGGPAVTAPAVLCASAVAIWHTVDGSGPFAGPEVHHSLVLLQVFMGVLSGTALLVAAAIAERDDSERRERDAGRVLRHRDEMLRLAQRAGGVATFEYDYVNHTAQCSPEFFEIFGLPGRDGHITAQEWAQFVHPDDRERIAAHLANAIAGAEPAIADYRIKTAAGDVRWLSYSGQLQATPDGGRMLGTVVDITERKRLEADLRHHAAEVERVLETIGEGFVALDGEFRYVYVNKAAEQMLGRSREELRGRVSWESVVADTVRDSREQLESAKRLGLPRRYEVHIADSNRWYENRVYPSPDGLSIFFADVTARVEASAALLESQDVLSLAMRGGAMGAWSRNMATNEVWWSPELEEIVGLAPGSFSRTEAAFFELVHHDDRPGVRTAIEEAVERRADYIVEFRFAHASGEWRWMEGRGRAVYGDDGAPRTIYGIGIDVTERKRAEMALREAKIAAESANELKDQFLATLSHELRTPLNVILGYARLLQTHSIPASDQQRAFDVIARNAVAQNQLVDDLLDMSRITTGKFRLDPRPILVATVLRDAVENVKPAADAKGIALGVEVEPDAGMVLADPTRLQQVFWNLLANAVKFTPKGGRIAVSVLRDAGTIEVRISDTGAGISPEFLPFVFEPFRQAAAGFDRAHGGLGLGLAISRQLVELHGGTIQAESPGVGHGATFTIRLSRIDEGATAPGGRAGADDVRGVAARESLADVNILLVDDEPDTLTMFRKALEEAGAHVRAVGNGTEALAALEGWQPDLLVTDLGLPGMDGYELFQAVRASRPDGVVPAVAVSAYARADDRARALAAGFLAHIAKPIDPLSLVRVLTSTLSAAD